MTRPTRSPSPSEVDRRRALGRRGEEATAVWYLGAGYEVVDRNWRCPAGEIDLVVSHLCTGTVVFCEVKTRSSTAFGTPTEAVTVAKQRRLRRLGASWLAEHRATGARARPVRFDVAAVMDDGTGALSVEVVADAF